MRLETKTYNQIVRDLGLDTTFLRGQAKPVRNCWHFYTNGRSVDAMFIDEDDFVNGMNRVYVVSRKYSIVILAFILMDTHVHFVLYGMFEECNRFMHDYIQRTSRFISLHRDERNKLRNAQISHQTIQDDTYLKTVICYTVKNAPVGGLPYLGLDYPWGSGSLYFRHNSFWTSPAWIELESEAISALGCHRKRSLLKTRAVPAEEASLSGSMVLPGEYVAYQIVEQLFKTVKSFTYFYGRTREEDVDGKQGSISYLSLPMQEMRQHKNEMCKEMFGCTSVKTLNTQQRIKLARALRSQYNSSPRQIIRLCGLVYDEVKDRL